MGGVNRIIGLTSRLGRVKFDILSFFVSVIVTKVEGITLTTLYIIAMVVNIKDQVSHPRGVITAAATSFKCY